ncbi:21132_t:CDS:1, partial [Racocetra persica]
DLQHYPKHDVKNVKILSDLQSFSLVLLITKKTQPFRCNYFGIKVFLRQNQKEK